MAKGKTKFPIDAVSGVIQGNDRTIGRDKGMAVKFYQRKWRKK